MKKVSKLGGFILAIFVLLFMFSTVVHAEASTVKKSETEFFNNLQGDSKSESSGASTYSTAGMLVKTVFYLAVILGLFYFIVKYVAKYKARRPNAKVAVIGGTSIGQNKSVKIVKVGTSAYVLGVGDTVNLIDKITDLAEIEMLEEETQVETLNVPKFNIFELLKKKVQHNSSFSNLFKEKVNANVQNKTVGELEAMLKEQTEKDQSRDEK